MDLLQAAGMPVLVGYGKGVKLSIPKFTMEDIVTLSAKIQEERISSQTNGMDDGQRMQFLAFYPPLPPDMQEIKRYVRTPAGMSYVCETCLPRATRKESGVPDRPLSGEEISVIIKKGPSVLGPLSWAVADLEERPLTAPKPPEGDEDDKGNS